MHITRHFDSLQESTVHTQMGNLLRVLVEALQSSQVTEAPLHHCWLALASARAIFLLQHTIISLLSTPLDVGTNMKAWLAAPSHRVGQSESPVVAT